MFFFSSKKVDFDVEELENAFTRNGEKGKNSWAIVCDGRLLNQRSEE
jgi:hypothetical protein